MLDPSEGNFSNVLINWNYDADGRLTKEIYDYQNDGTGGTNAVTADDYTDTY